VHPFSKQQWRRTAVALAIAASSLFTFTERAEAHPANDCSNVGNPTLCNHRRTWAEATVYIVARPNFLARPASWTDRLRDARDAWPTSTGRPGLSVTSIGPASACSSGDDPTYTGKINVFYGDVQANGGPSGAIGLTCLYPAAFSGDGYRMRRADVIVDDDPSSPWTSSGASDIPSGTLDLQSLLTHELGHALGLWGHFAPGEAICNPDSLDYHTMCQGLTPGTVRRRTPEAHDLHVQTDAYS
jgi:hypothetical protein